MKRDFHKIKILTVLAVLTVFYQEAATKKIGTFASFPYLRAHRAAKNGRAAQNHLTLRTKKELASARALDFDLLSPASSRRPGSGGPQPVAGRQLAICQPTVSAFCVLNPFCAQFVCTVHPEDKRSKSELLA